MKSPFFNDSLIYQCKVRLLQKRGELLNRFHTLHLDFIQSDRSYSGDEMDQTSTMQAEHAYVVNQSRLREQLIEIEFALARIENGNFGICEETSEPIEIERLLAIPWTRLSIEGAEIREVSSKKFA